MISLERVFENLKDSNGVELEILLSKERLVVDWIQKQTSFYAFNERLCTNNVTILCRRWTLCTNVFFSILRFEIESFLFHKAVALNEILVV